MYIVSHSAPSVFVSPVVADAAAAAAGQLRTVRPWELSALLGGFASGVRVSSVVRAVC